MNRFARFALSLLLVVSTHSLGEEGTFSPPEDGFDWIRLTSGEWLRGEIIGLFNDELEFDSDVLDDLVIDWEDVSELHSPRTLGIRVQGLQPYDGRVRITDSDVVIIYGEDEWVYPREHLISLTISAEREWDRWSGEISLGTNVRRGNTDFVEHNAIAHLERRTPLSRIFIDYIGNFNETEGIKVTNNHRVSGVYDRFSDSRFFWRPLNSQYFRDPFQNIAHQITVETGVGYELINNKRTEWEIYASVGANSVERVSVESDQEKTSRSPSMSLGTDYEIELTDWIDYLLSFQMTFVDEASGDYQHHLLTTISTDLWRDLDFDVSLVWDRTQNPPPNAVGETPEQDDFRLMIGISFEF